MKRRPIDAEPGLIKVEVEPCGRGWLVHAHYDRGDGKVDTDTQPVENFTSLVRILAGPLGVHERTAVNTVNEVRRNG